MEKQDKLEDQEVAPVDVPATKKNQSASFFQLFRYLEGTDYIVFGIGLIFAICQGVAVPAFGIFFGESVDAIGLPCAEGGCAWKAMKPVVEKLAMLGCIIFACGAVWQAALLYCAERQAARMRVAYFRAALLMDTEWYDVNEAASLPTKMASEVQLVQDAIGSKTGLVVQLAAQFVSSLIIGYVMGWKLALVMSATIPFFVVIGMYAARATEAYTSEKQGWYARAGAVAEETLMAIRTVSAFGGERREAERYSSKLSKAKAGGVKAGYHMGLSFGLALGIWGFCYGVGMWYAGHVLIANDGWTGGEVMQVFFSVIIGASGLNDAGNPIMTIFMARAAAGDAFAVIDAQSKIEPKTEMRTGTSSKPEVPKEIATVERLEFKDVHFNFPSRPDNPVLRGLSLAFNKGQKVALVGESGSGKSTVIQLIERFYDPATGSVMVNGIDISTLPVRAWRKQIGYVGQEPVLFATSVMNNIKGADDTITDEMAIAAAKQAQAFDFLDKLPLKFDTHVGIGGGQMSGGQKQRIAIARAIVKTPQILLLDEATSALDNQSEKEVQSTIDKIQAETSLTTISIAHRLSTIRNSDLIYFLKGGIVCESGSHPEMMAKEGEYYKLVKTQEGQAAREEEDASANPSNEPRQRIVTDGSKENVEDEAETAKKERAAQAKAKLSEEEIEQQRIAKLNEEKYQAPLKRIFDIGRPVMWVLPFGFFGAALDACAFPVTMYCLVMAIEAFFIPAMGGTIDDMKEKVNTWALGCMACGLANVIGDFLKFASFTYYQESIVLLLRKAAFTSLLRQDVGFFDDPENGPAGLTTALARQTQQVSMLVGVSLGNIFGTLCAIICGLVFAFVATWELTLCLLIMIPILGAGLAVVFSMMVSNSSGNKAYSKAGEVASEAVLNMRTVRALLVEHQLVDIFHETVWEVAKAQQRRTPKIGVAYGFGNCSWFGLFGAGFGIGAVFIDQGMITATELMTSMMCVMGGALGAGLAMSFAPDASKGKLAAYDVFRLMDRPSRIDALSPIGTHKSLGDGTITFTNVKFTYPHRLELPVLKGLDFIVSRGQSVAFVGPSGSGKSTCIQLLQRFYDPTEGSLKVGGVDLREFDISYWRQQVGYVGQEPVLFDTTLEENVRYGKPDATAAELAEVAKMANMDYLTTGKVSWSDKVGAKGGKLSGGQKQRAAIARALLRKPSVLLLDEATSALDSVSERVVQDALDVAKRGRTTFTIAHRLSTIQDCDKIVVIVSGMLAEQGNHEELMAMKGVYWTLVQKGRQ